MKGVKDDITPLHRWRLYPVKGSSLFVAVNIWRTLDELRTHERRGGGWTGNLDTWAFCSTYARRKYGPDGRGVMLRDFAEVNFTPDYMGVTIVTHELLHAALGWARRSRFNFDALRRHERYDVTEEERLCHVHSKLVHDFAHRARAAGFYGSD